MAQPRRLRTMVIRLSRGLLGMALIFPGLARGAEFSALMMIKDGDKVISGRIYVLNDKMRQEFNDAEGQTITIVRPDKKAIWIVMPQKRTYLELPLKSRLPGQFIQIPPSAREKRLVRQERVNGYDADRYDFTVYNKSELEKQTVWMAPKLGAPIKMTASERNFSVEYKNIKEGGVPPPLFELPPGYQKMTTPGSFAAKVLE
jgi:hypothetical protein